MTRSILVVDDDPAVLRTLERGLERRGYDVMCATTPDAAYSMLDDPRVDVILLDLWMPEISGDALALAITRRWPRMEGRVVLMSGDPTMLERLQDQGSPFPVLAKPFTFSQVYRLIEAVAGEHRAKPRTGTTDGFS